MAGLGAKKESFRRGMEAFRSSGASFGAEARNESKFSKPLQVGQSF
jgi:hypothetical protein